MKENAAAQALTVSWSESVTARRRTGRGGTETGTGEKGGTRKGVDPVAQTGTKTDENAKEVPAGSGGTNAGRRKETEGRTGAGGRSGITIRIKTEGRRGTGLGRGRTGERLMSEGTKKTGTDTGKTGSPNDPAGAAAKSDGTKVGEMRRGRGSTAPAERGSASGTENRDITNAVAAKRGTVSESPVMNIVSIVTAGGVGALSKQPAVIFTFSVFLPFLRSSDQLCDEEEDQHADVASESLWPT